MARGKVGQCDHVSPRCCAVSFVSSRCSQNVGASPRGVHTACQLRRSSVLRHKRRARAVARSQKQAGGSIDLRPQLASSRGYSAHLDRHDASCSCGRSAWRISRQGADDTRERCFESELTLEPRLNYCSPGRRDHDGSVGGSGAVSEPLVRTLADSEMARPVGGVI